MRREPITTVFVKYSYKSRHVLISQQCYTTQYVVNIKHWKKESNKGNNI